LQRTGLFFMRHDAKSLFLPPRFFPDATIKINKAT